MVRHAPDRSARVQPRTVLLLATCVLGLTACRERRGAAEARRALGSQLGGVSRQGEPVQSVARARQAAQADDLASARRALEATLRLDPANENARAALAGLGGITPDDAIGLDGAATPHALAAFSSTPRTVPVGTAPSDGRASAVAPNVAVPRAVTPVRAATRSVAPAASDSTAARSAALPTTLAQAGEIEVERGAAEPRAAAAVEDTLVSAPRPAIALHRRTWPWTRMQRWLVAKGLAGGAGAGVVVGALVGNVPGALLAGSLGGGALGFKRATRIGPAAPYPSPRDSIAFENARRARDSERAERPPEQHTPDQTSPSRVSAMDSIRASAPGAAVDTAAEAHVAVARP